MRNAPRRLAARLVLTFLVPSLATVAITVGIVFVSARQSLIEAAYGRMESTAALKIDELRRWVADQRQDVLLIAVLPETRRMAGSLAGLRPQDPGYPAARQILRDHLANIAARKPDLLEVFLLDGQTGSVLVSTNEPHEGKNHASEPFFTLGSQAVTVLSEPGASPARQQTITISAPLLNDVGRQLNIVLAARLNLHRVNKIVLQDAVPGGGETFLVDPHGVLISRNGMRAGDPAPEAHSPAIAAVVQGRDGRGLYRNHQGVPVIGVYRWLGRYTLGLVTESPQDQALASARSLAWTVLAVGLAMSGVVTAAVLLLARRITIPVLAVADAAGRLAGGDLEAAAPEAANDEIGDLARAFNQMAAQLRTVYDTLRRKEVYFRSLIENVADIIMVLDASGRIRHASPAVSRTLGQEPDRLDGRDLLDMVHPEDREHARAALAECLRRPGEAARLEARLQRGDGTWRILEGLLRDLLDDPAVGGVVGNFRDVTWRREAERSLEELNRHLEQLVEERTAELSERARDLELANARLREIDELKTDFLSSASHELRTPLTSVLGFAKMVARDFARSFLPLAGEDEALTRRAERILSNLDIVEQEGGRLTRLINDILDLTKIESGRLEWHDRTFTPDQAVRKAAQAVSGQYAQKPALALRIEVAGELRTLHADPDRIQQVLINLLNNAFKFTDSGEVKVIARMSGPATVQLRVEDTGVGISAEYREAIFQKYRQADRGDRPGDRPPGTGLGLTISRQIVEHYGGRIWAESEPGRGSAFIVELPAGE
ncbi:MAG: ATP-binding protein [Thermodesulfobacteriota bacterium]